MSKKTSNMFIEVLNTDAGKYGALAVVGLIGGLFVYKKLFNVGKEIGTGIIEVGEVLTDKASQAICEAKNAIVATSSDLVASATKPHIGNTAPVKAIADAGEGFLQYVPFVGPYISNVNMQYSELTSAGIRADKQVNTTDNYDANVNTKTIPY
jgi:hypothetical protein